MTFTPSHDSDATFTGEPAGETRGLTRRQVTTAAAWAAPVIALAVATPLAAASEVFDSPTAFVSGALAATGTSATQRTATYEGGALNYNSAGVPGLNSGDITISVYNNKTASWTLTTDVVTAYQAAGWVLVTASPESTVFIHSAISNGATISMPAISWSAPAGSSKPVLGIMVSSDNDDVSGLGVSLN
ncbi:hypothetical protein [Herbiconiux sp. VKM Ac-2851]|uniref:hypothetical protein n=1 Tax=Herbiconiux sp. VKM Ac-2851 TaxID=2739025 RepID=UPI0015676FFA|nr:hypothetical protein [Herbiconiux sp. VKM Ac-2851]NQX35555.1 hypothetical protein [Herbiconiux sp. VKM Ac-2851]